MGHPPHGRGWRDGFWGRESVEDDPAYLHGYEAGYRAGDRTRPPAGTHPGSPAPDLAASCVDGEVGEPSSEAP